MGRASFTPAEIHELRALICEKQTADRARQKIIRARMRGIGFHIADFADYSGFALSDFDDLLSRGIITESAAPNDADHRKIVGGFAIASPCRDERAGGGERAAWYEELREQYRPIRLRVLLVAESPPDSGDGERRFFYSPTLRVDNLYRGVAAAVYGNRADVDLREKAHVLELLRDDGFWLIDAVEHPINKHAATVRRSAIRHAAPILVERCRQLAPELGVVICHGVVYAEVAGPLRAAGVPVLHDVPLPFPLGNWRTQFVTGVRDALAGARNRPTG